MHEKYMKVAIKEAEKAYKKGEMPIGVVIVKNNKIISRAHNTKENTKNPICHAEINAIEKACKKNDDWRLDKCTIYTTLEPCLMCMGAIVESRIGEVVYGTTNCKNSDINEKIYAKNKVNVVKNVLNDECLNLLKKFFNNIRNI